MSRNSYDPSNDTLTQIGGWQSVDNALSSTSTNPVQNKVVKDALDTKADASAIASLNEALTNEVTTRAATGAKNFLSNASGSVSKVNNYTTWILNSDGTWDASRTSSEGSASDLRLMNLETVGAIPKGNYILSGCPSGGGTQTYRIVFLVYNSTKTQVLGSYSDTGEGASITIPSDDCTIRCELTVYPVVVSGIKFKPMLRLATDTDPTYQPYAMTNRELTERETANKLADTVSLASYSSSYYTFPSDGYVYLYAGGASNTIAMDIYGSDLNAAISLQVSNYGTSSFFVKKGMKTKVTTNTEQDSSHKNRIYYLPLS